MQTSLLEETAEKMDGLTKDLQIRHREEGSDEAIS